ncbi:hypothetical protein [Butyrivibrio sp. WCD3002]|uniref:hypothetical protein n=1 Tax=Butyrivibrio sp. WCD3002 TaxID=1280676 RepID=UPI00041027E5|nr:hypothetical protein [Butyrivibrio sp. WCD3002]
MEYVEQVLSRADFSKETTLMATLKTQLFPKVNKITFDELKEKNGLGSKDHERTKADKGHQRVREDVKQINPPKKNGPRM